MCFGTATLSRCTFLVGRIGAGHTRNAHWSRNATYQRVDHEICGPAVASLASLLLRVVIHAGFICLPKCLHVHALGVALWACVLLVALLHFLQLFCFSLLNGGTSDSTARGLDLYEFRR